jgi:cytochrome P450
MSSAEVPQFPLAAGPNGMPPPELMPGVCPVLQTVQGEKVHVLTNPKDVRRALADNAFGLAGVDSNYAVTAAGYQDPQGLLRLDGPEHRTRKRAIMRGLHPEAIATQGPTLRAIAGEILDRIPTDTDVDLAPAYINPFIRAACDSLGMAGQSVNILFFTAPRTLRVLRAPVQEDQAVTLRKSWDALYDLAGELIDEQRRAVPDSILSHIIANLEEAGVVGDTLVKTYTSFLNGFFTVPPILGSCITELLSRPELVQACLADPTQWDATILEAMRFKAHVYFALPRLALRDAVLEDRTIQAGQVVLPSLSAALHHSTQVERPDELDPAQTADRRLIFGAGPHYCPGAELSLSWLRIGVRSFFERFPEAELSDNLNYTRVASATPIASSYVRMRPAAPDR